MVGIYLNLRGVSMIDKEQEKRMANLKKAKDKEELLAAVISYRKEIEQQREHELRMARRLHSIGSFLFITACNLIVGSILYVILMFAYGRE